jgi:hypothetical protein
VKLLKILFFFSVFIAHSAFAVELTVFMGPLSHSAASGCCKSSGSANANGILGRFDFERVGPLEFAVLTNGRWSEGSLLKPFYLYGQGPRFDTGTGDMIRAQTISDWRWISSVGVGYYSHTTTTSDFNLPILVAGLSLTNMNQFIYSINDEWSLAAMVQLTFGWSKSDTSFLVGNYVGLVYNMK